jgi:hypothetical protein
LTSGDLSCNDSVTDRPVSSKRRIRFAYSGFAEYAPAVRGFDAEEEGDSLEVELLGAAAAVADEQAEVASTEALPLGLRDDEDDDFLFIL